MKHPSHFLLVLGGTSYGITWDNAAVFRADDTGLADKLSKGKFGYSVLCRMIFVMLDDKTRDKVFTSPEAVAAALPPAKTAEAWELVMKAYAAGTGTEDTDAKKGTDAGVPSPASN